MRFNVARVQFEIGCNATFPLGNEFLSISSSSKWFYRKVSSANGSNFLLLDFVSLNQDTCPHVASPSCTSVLDDGHKQLAEDSSLRLFIKKSLCDCNLSSYPFMDYIKLKGHKQSYTFGWHHAKFRLSLTKLWRQREVHSWDLRIRRTNGDAERQDKHGKWNAGDKKNKKNIGWQKLASMQTLLNWVCKKLGNSPHIWLLSFKT